MSKNTKLEILCLTGNPKLSKLNVSKNTKLQVLACGFTGIKKLDLAKNKSLITVMNMHFIPYTYSAKGYSGKAMVFGEYGQGGAFEVECPVGAKIYNGKKVLYKSGKPANLALDKVILDSTGKKVSVKNNALTIKRDKGYYLRIKLSPAGVASNCKFRTSNKKVVMVDSNGYFFGLKKGSATLTMTTTGKSGKTLDLTINVTVK